MLVPVFMLLLLGMLEFGFIFDHTMTITYATREGARSGAAFARGDPLTMPCTASVDVDKYIIAAVQRVLEAPGSLVTAKGVQNIKIYSADSAGVQLSNAVNVWTYTPLADGPSVDGRNLDFKQQGATGWDACARVNWWTAAIPPALPIPPESIGVSVSYNYTYVTPLGAMVGFFGPPGTSTLLISDRTVMALNPKE
jgi:hypothetical protein